MQASQPTSVPTLRRAGAAPRLFASVVGVIAALSCMVHPGCKAGKKGATFPAPPPGEVSRTQNPAPPGAARDATPPPPPVARASTAPAPAPDTPRASESGLEVWWWTIDEGRGDPRSVIASKGEVKPLDEDQARVVTRLGLRIVKDDARLVTLKSEGGEDLAQLTPKQIAGLSAIGLRPVALGYTSIEERLAKYVERPTPLTTDALESWRRSGLRVLSVPRSELLALQRSLPIKGEANRESLGELHEWKPLIVGPAWPDAGAVLLPGGVLELPPGRMRLLARCFLVPTPSERAMTSRLRVEIVPQHEESQSNKDRWSLAAGIKARPTLADQGLLLERLRADFFLDGDEALLLIPQGAGASQMNASHEALDGAPIAAPAPTLGQALLMGAGDVRAVALDARARAIIVLVPRIPAEMRLLP